MNYSADERDNRELLCIFVFIRPVCLVILIRNCFFNKEVNVIIPLCHLQCNYWLTISFFFLTNHLRAYIYFFSASLMKTNDRGINGNI